jgi:hemolysin-activating ACP:hemolysin acyltransferase
MDKIINFYKTFNKYKNNNYDDIYYHILPSINSNQYKIFEDQQGLYGFVNWAFINKEEEDNYKLKGMIKKDKWQSGNNLWLYDILISKNAREVMSWVYNYFKNYLKVNECINWLRLDNNNNIYRISKKYKREFHI